MKLLPDKSGMREFLGWLNYEKYKEGVQFQEVQKILVSTNQSREPKGSIYLETFFEQQLQQKPLSLLNYLPMRCQSEEPEMKKRKPFMVDTEELEEAAVSSREAEVHQSSASPANVFDLKRVVQARRIHPVKPVKKPAVKEVISLVDEEKYDPPWLEPGVIYTPEQRVQYYKVRDKAKAKEDARFAAAARDAQQPQAQKEGPFTTIQDCRHEHEKKQREEAAANKRRFSQVNSYPQGDSMTKPKVNGAFQPTNRLFKNETAQRPGWGTLKADSHAGRQASQNPPYTLQDPRKRQKVEHEPRPTNGSSRSPIDVDRDTSERQRQGSMARSGHSQTVHDSQKNASGGEMGNVREYRQSEDAVKLNRSRRPRPRPSGGFDSYSNSGGPYKFKEPARSFSNHTLEDARDPIDDLEFAGKHTTQRSTRLEVQIPSCLPGDKGSSFQQPARQHFDKNERVQMNKKQRSSADSESSPYFIPDLKPSNTRSVPKPVSDGEVAQTKNKATGVSRRKASGIVDLEFSGDELDYQPDDEEAKMMAKKLLAGDKTRDTESINVDDSDDENVADIAPTKFSKVNSKAPLLVGKYKLRQLFSRDNAWLRETDEKIWTMELNKEKKCLELFNERGDSEQILAINTFSFLENHEQSAKVVVHRHLDHRSLNPTKIHMEFSKLKGCENFASDMISAYKLIVRHKDSKEYLDRVFDRALEELNTVPASKSNSKTKRLRDEDLPDDLQVAVENSARRHADTWSRAQNSKRARVTGPDRPQTINNDQMAPLYKPGLVKNMKSEPMDIDRKEDRLRSFKHHQLPEEVPPKTFYGGSTSSPADTGIPHETRSSTRAAGTRAAPPLGPSPEIPDAWTKLNPDWANEYNWRGSIVYPPQGRIRATVDKQDIYRLDEGEFLNDNLVTFYLCWLENQVKEKTPDVAKRIYFHNSFFFEKLSKPAKGSKDIINYEAVKKWTAKDNLFDYDYIVVPVNENLHWYVAIICNAPKLAKDAQAAENARFESDSQDGAKPDDAGKATAKSNSASPSPASSLTPKTQEMSLNDKIAEDFGPSKSLDEGTAERKPVLPPESDSGHHSVNSSPPPIVSDIVPSDTKANQPKKGKKKGPPPRKHDPSAFRIITLDSFHGAHSPCCTKLKKYLIQEMKTKLHIEAQDPGIVGMTAKNIPVQSNYSDCGLFLLNYIDEFLKNPDGFIQEILQNSLDIEKEWPPASETRNRVRDLLFELQREQNGGGKVEKEGGKTKSTTKVEKNISTSSTSGISAQPSRSSQASPVPGNQKQINAATDNLHSKKVQSTKAAEPEPMRSKPAKPLIAPRGDHNTEQRHSDAPETTQKSDKGIGGMYSAIAGGITELHTTIKNGLFGTSRSTSEDSGHKPTAKNQEIVVIDDWTQHSSFHAGDGTSNGQPLEVSDSQAQSSARASIEGERSAARNTKRSKFPTEIPESPQSPEPPESKVVQKTTLGKRPRGTEHLESPTPPDGHSHLRNYEDDLKDIALGSPSPEPRNDASESDFQDFGPDSQNATPEEDEIDLLSTFEVPPLQLGIGSHDGTDSEMLLPNCEPKPVVGSYGHPDESLLSSPPATSTPFGISHDDSDPASPTPALRQQVSHVDSTTNLLKGKKRKSLVIDDGTTEHPRSASHSSKRHTDAAGVKITSKKRKVAEDVERIRIRSRSLEPDLRRDASDRAIIGRHRNSSHPRRS